jgi:replication factor A1
VQVEQDGRYWCEGDGKYVEAPEHRYMITVRLADPTGETYSTVFNEQVGHTGQDTAH